MFGALAYSMTASASFPAYFIVAALGVSMMKLSVLVMSADTFSMSPPHQSAVAALCQPSSYSSPPALSDGS